MVTGTRSEWLSGGERRHAQQAGMAFSASAVPGVGRNAQQAFDGSNDPEVSCARCGRHLGKDSRLWWDDYTCEYCHEARAA